MIDQLKIVQKAAGKKGSPSIMQHIHINDGIVTAMNGSVAIQAAIPSLHDVNATVPAAQFVTAIAACKGEPSIKVTEHNVIVKGGAFRAQIGITTDPFPVTEWDGEHYAVPDSFLSSLAKARKFSGGRFEGVLNDNGYLYATDNNTMVRMDNGIDARFSLSDDAVDVLLAINLRPDYCELADNYVMFVYPGVSVRCNLMAINWPDMARFVEFDTSDLPAIPEGLPDAVATVAQFMTAENVEFMAGCVMGGGATVQVDSALPDAAIRVASIKTLLTVMDHADFTASPMRFSGPGVVGVCAGVKQQVKKEAA